MGPWSQRHLCTEGRACEDSQGEGFANMTLEWHTEGIPKNANRYQETGAGARHGAGCLSALTRSTYYYHQFLQNCRTIMCHCLSVCSVRAAGSKPIQVAFSSLWNETPQPQRASAIYSWCGQLQMCYGERLVLDGGLTDTFVCARRSERRESRYLGKAHVFEWCSIAVR